MAITRRQFIKKTIGAGLAMQIPGILLGGLSEKVSGETIKEFSFTASKAKVNLGGGADFVAWTYNKQVPGPEIRVKEGDRIRVHVKNLLPQETTIHWHGLPVPNAMDGVPGVTQAGIAPGASFTYEFEAKPAGTFIYHSHVGYQLDQGLYGALIIEPRHEIRAYDAEYTLLLEDWVMKDGGGTAKTSRRSPSRMGMMGGMGGMMGRRSSPEKGPLLEPVYDAYAVNGKIFPEIDPIVVKKGDRIKLRLANPSSSTMYSLRLAGHKLTVTHADGNPVEPVEVDILRIGMGERYDVEVIANNPGYWLLTARDSGLGEAQVKIPLIYKGIRSKKAAHPSFSGDLKMLDYSDLVAAIPDEKPQSTRANKVFRQRLSGGMHSPYWMINGQVYPNAEKLLVNEWERIRISYWNHSMMPHPMHLHGHFFKLVNPTQAPDLWVLKDTVIVDPMRGMDLEFVTDNPGKWFHHCHNLYHLMAGMANTVVYT